MKGEGEEVCKREGERGGGGQRNGDRERWAKGNEEPERD